MSSCCMLLLEVGSVSRRDVADWDAQRPSPVTGDVSCDHITILSSVAYSTSLCYQEVSVCVNISHISLTTSATRQILCPQSGSLYLVRASPFQPSAIHSPLPASIILLQQKWTTLLIMQETSLLVCCPSGSRCDTRCTVSILKERGTMPPGIAKASSRWVY